MPIIPKVKNPVNRHGKVIGIKLPELPRKLFSKQRQYAYDLLHNGHENIHLEVTKSGPNQGCIKIKPKSSKYSKISKVYFEIRHTDSGKHIFLSDLSKLTAPREEKFIQQIFAEIETIAKEKGANKLAFSIFQANKRAINVYKKYGFKIVKNNIIGREPTYRMEKKL